MYEYTCLSTKILSDWFPEASLHILINKSPSQLNSWGMTVSAETLPLTYPTEPKTQISWYFTVQIQMETVIKFLRIFGGEHFQCDTLMQSWQISGRAHFQLHCHINSRLPQVPSKSHFWGTPLGKNLIEKTGKPRNSCRVKGSGVGAQGMVTKGAKWRVPGNSTKRSKIVFAVTRIALSLGHLTARLLGLPAQSLIETLGTISISLNQHNGKICLKST